MFALESLYLPWKTLMFVLPALNVGYLFEYYKKNIQYAFIPSHFHGSDQEFQEIMDHYRPLGIKKFLKLEVDSHYSSVFKKSVFKSDIIVSIA